MQIQRIAVLHLGEGVQDQPGRQALGNRTGKRDTGHIQLADDDKKQVEKDVDHTGHGQVGQRLFCLADGAEYRIAVVVERQRRHAQKIDTQVKDRAGQQILLRVEQPQQRGGAEQPHGQQQNTGEQADHQRRMDGLADILVVAGTIVPRDQDIDAVAQADEKAGEKGDKGGGGADGAQCGRARKAAHHGNIGHVEKDLQQVGQCQRQTDEQDLLGQRALGHGFGFCLTAHDLVILLLIYNNGQPSHAVVGKDRVVLPQDHPARCAGLVHVDQSLVA